MGKRRRPMRAGIRRGWIGQRRRDGPKEPAIGAGIGEARPKPARSLPRIKHPPHRPVAILADQQRAVLRHGDADRPAPDVASSDRRSRSGNPRIRRSACRPSNAAASPCSRCAWCGSRSRASPRRRRRDTRPGNAAAFIEGDAERRRMRLDQHVGHGDACPARSGPLALVARVLVVADVDTRASRRTRRRRPRSRNPAAGRRRARRAR